jgi:ABC-2 type transport system permease protein
VRKIWVVIRREFVEKVRNKWFVISTILGPVLMAAFIVVPIVMASQGATERRVRVVDVSTIGFGQRVVDLLSGPVPVRASLLNVQVGELDAVTDSLTVLVGQKALDGYLIVTDATVDDGTVEYRGANVSSQADMSIIRRVLGEGVLEMRLARAGVDRAVVAAAQIPVQMRTVSIRGGELTDSSGEAAFILAYAVWMIQYMAILFYGVQVMGAVVEEKTSRVVEVLVSSLRPFQLLAGKVLGAGLVGLFQLSIWGVSAWFLFQKRDVLLRLAGVPVIGGNSGFPFPEVSLDTLAIVLAYFLLGYFLYAAMFAAVAAMSNSEAEARQAQVPVVMLLVIPSILIIGILQQPDGGMAVALSMIPFCSPIGMPVRWAAATVPLSEIAASLAILFGTVVLIVWVAARIYRVGILMYGKRPGAREIVRWIRA